LEHFRLGCVAAQVHKNAAYIHRVQLVTVQAGLYLLEQSIVRSVVHHRPRGSYTQDDYSATMLRNLPTSSSFIGPPCPLPNAVIKYLIQRYLTTALVIAYSKAITRLFNFVNEFLILEPIAL